MKFIKTGLPDAYIIEMEPSSDERGFFGRTFCTKEFADQGINPSIVQANQSKSSTAGTLRGLHYQVSPQEETKIVKCIHGAIFDVIVDIRPDSPTYGKWYGETLTPKNYKMMYVPKGFAHGFFTLENDSEIIYFVSQYYSKEHERGIRWNDPFFSIVWPGVPTVISERDNLHPDYSPETHLIKA